MANSSRITYSDRQLLGTFPAAGAALAQGNVTPPLAVDADTREETLIVYPPGATPSDLGVNKIPARRLTQRVSRRAGISSQIAFRLQCP
jgi:hypothetical protein